LRSDGTAIEEFPFFSIVAQRWIVALRASWAVLLAIGVAASLCACSDRPAAESLAAPAVADASDALRHYGSFTEPRIRHRPVAKRARHRHEVQQADAEWVNPPFGAGE
jgi:hypothetical protein